MATTQQSSDWREENRPGFSGGSVSWVRPPRLGPGAQQIQVGWRPAGVAPSQAGPSVFGSRHTLGRMRISFAA